MTTESVQTELEAELAQLQAEQAETNVRVARATIIIAMGNLLGRVLGLTREIALTNLFGASRAVDAFGFATSIPTSFYDLLIGGHVNSALVPVLSEVIARDGRKALWQLVSILCSLVTVILSGLVLLLIIFAPQVVSIVGSGFDAEKMELATHLLRLIAPSLIFMSLFAVLSGTLYALREFTWPAFAGVVFNGCIVLATIFLSPPFQFTPTFNINSVPIRIEWVMARSPDAIAAAAIGWLIGSLAQLGLQCFGMRGASLRPSFQWNHPAVRKIGRLYLPVMLSLIMDTLVIRPFSLNLASQ